MLQWGAISPVTVLTTWCPCLGPAPKKAGENRFLTRLDANSGFWQLSLDEESQLLTTFITPFCRYCFNRLLFGISSAPNIFQRTLSEVLNGSRGRNLPNGWHSRPELEHDRAWLQEAGITLNIEKWQFSRPLWNSKAPLLTNREYIIHADLMKTKAISEFPPPQNGKDLQRFMGMVNHLGKFIPQLAEMSEPLHQLLCKDNTWLWTDPRQRAFEQIKRPSHRLMF